jgi:hypothetical protein
MIELGGDALIGEYHLGFGCNEIQELRSTGSLHEGNVRPPDVDMESPIPREEDEEVLHVHQPQIGFQTILDLFSWIQNAIDIALIADLLFFPTTTSPFLREIL